jgi:glycosyltransferase involved in cell wall biosynthesis
LATKTVFVSPTVRAAAPIATCVPSRKQVLIYNGILCDELYARAHAQQKMRSQLGFTEQDFIIGMVGRLVPVKNQQLLIMLVEQLRHVYPQLRLLILGHGPLLQEYNNYIQIHNLREHVRIIHDTALGYYRLFDCFVLPSKTEGLSIALLEAMSFKLPVVVARTAGVCGVIEHGSNGLIFDTENLAELARCIQSLMAEPQLRVTLGEGALKTVQMRFAIDAMLAAYRNLFDTLSIDNLPG